MGDDWWLRLMYEDPTPVRELRAVHLVKWHVSAVRHLDTAHGWRFAGQVPLDDVTALHNDLHRSEERT